MLIQISDKEQKRIESATNYYTRQGHTVEVTNLEIGDYIFNNEVVFEFKTISDFIASIQDHRVFNEAINQAENYDHHFVIIQGDEHMRAKAIAMSKHYQPVSYYGYLGAIASLNRYTTVIESYSPLINEAYYRMLITAKKALNNKPIVKKFSKKHKNSALNWLIYCNYGLNYKRSKAIIDKLNLKTLKDLQELTFEDLTSVEGVGKTIANRIMEGLK